jgi:hypothetical protein
MHTIRFQEEILLTCCWFLPGLISTLPGHFIFWVLLELERGKDQEGRQQFGRHLTPGSSAPLRSPPATRCAAASAAAAARGRAREEGRESNAAKGGAPRKWPRQTVRRSPPSLYLQHQTRGNPQRGWHLEQVEIGNYLILTVMVPDSGGAEAGPKSRVCLRDNAQLHSE